MDSSWCYKNEFLVHVQKEIEWKKILKKDEMIIVKARKLRTLGNV